MSPRWVERGGCWAVFRSHGGIHVTGSAEEWVGRLVASECDFSEGFLPSGDHT